MAKVKDFDEITLSELDGNDIFYVIDYKTEGDPDPKSKKITYSRLTQDLNDHVGLNSLLTADTFKYDDKTYLCMVFELKNKSQKTLCVDVGDFINIYQGDGITISVDSENNIKVIASYLSSTTKLSEIDNNNISLYALKTDLSTYGGSNSIDVSGESNKTISVKIDPKGNLIVTDKGLSSGGSGGKGYESGRGITIEENIIATSAEYTTYDNIRSNLSNDGYSTNVIFRDWVVV